ncbi:MAG: hypothetical protein JO046_08810 [Solirubrobacterales bacterium]|nr:hypothetical protein [Solirubrobacterales bacterium]
MIGSGNDAPNIRAVVLDDVAAWDRGSLVSPRAVDGCIARVIQEPVRATPTSPAALLVPSGIGLLLRAGTNGRTTPTRPCADTLASTTAASSCRLCLCHACDHPERGGLLTAFLESDRPDALRPGHALWDEGVASVAAGVAIH